MVFTGSEAWKAAYPGASVGILALRGVTNPKHHPAFDDCREELAEQLRSRYAGYDRAALKALPVISAYNAYYKRFKKTYHVQLQLESIVMGGKSIPRVATLVESMFMAELKNHLLTAGHDLEAVELPAGIDVADGTEKYIRINGEEQQLKPGDMMISDATGIISSVLYGPDRRTRITPETEQVLFTVYAAPGIDEQLVSDHLRDILAYVLMIAPDAEVEALEVCGAA
ncbi:phenylalanine--tRNA ligase beta subunit-related protein [Candidatus Bipolaricaulota bacterium]